MQIEYAAFVFYNENAKKKKKDPEHSIHPPRYVLSESIILCQYRQAGETAQLSEEMRGAEEFRPPYLQGIRK